MSEDVPEMPINAQRAQVLTENLAAVLKRVEHAAAGREVLSLI